MPSADVRARGCCVIDRCQGWGLTANGFRSASGVNSGEEGLKGTGQACLIGRFSLWVLVSSGPSENSGEEGLDGTGEAWLEMSELVNSAI